MRVRLFLKKIVAPPQRKADVRFRWKTTMVHGDDKKSLHKIVFVSRCPWGASLLVLVCLFACPCDPAEASFTGSPVLRIGRSADLSAEKAPEAGIRARNLASQPNSYRRAMFFRSRLRNWEHGEAWSEAVCASPTALAAVSSETMHRSTRWTRNRCLGKYLFPRPARVSAEVPLAGDGFSPVARFL